MSLSLNNWAQDKTFGGWHFGVFFLFVFFFFPETGFGISYEFFPVETVCVRCEDLFSMEDGEGIVDLSSAELAKRVVKINWCEGLFPFISISVKYQDMFFFIISGSQWHPSRHMMLHRRWADVVWASFARCDVYSNLSSYMYFIVLIHSFQSLYLIWQ